jgi:hypothetical protein
MLAGVIPQSRTEIRKNKGLLNDPPEPDNPVHLFRNRESDRNVGSKQIPRGVGRDRKSPSTRELQGYSFLVSLSLAR